MDSDLDSDLISLADSSLDSDLDSDLELTTFNELCSRPLLSGQGGNQTQDCSHLSPVFCHYTFSLTISPVT